MHANAPVMLAASGPFQGQPKSLHPTTVSMISNTELPSGRGTTRGPLTGDRSAISLRPIALRLVALSFRPCDVPRFPHGEVLFLSAVASGFAAHPHSMRCRQCLLLKLDQRRLSGKAFVVTRRFRHASRPYPTAWDGPLQCFFQHGDSAENTGNTEKSEPQRRRLHHEAPEATPRSGGGHPPGVAR